MSIFLNSFVFFAAEESERGVFWCFAQNDIIGWFVIGVLVMLSIYAWSTICGRNKYLNRVNKENKDFEKSLKNVKFVDFCARGGNGVSFYERMMHHGYNAYKAHGGLPETREELNIRMSYVSNAVQRFLANSEERYSDKLPMLGSCVTLGPFVGLLGTVYGIIITFASLSEKASIAQLAPGVSAALTATMCGLFLAIPSVAAYNIFLAKSKRMYTELENFASIFIDNFEAGLRERMEELKCMREQEASSGTLTSEN